MNAQPVTTPTPPATELMAAVVNRLQTSCGEGATISYQSDGFSHAKKQQLFTIHLLAKNQDLTSLVTDKNIEILKCIAKRTGAVVRTTINVKVQNSSAHPQTKVNG